MHKILLILNLLSMSAFAQSELYNNREELNEVLNQNMYQPNYLNLVVGLVFVILLIYFTGIIYQKLIKFKLDSSDDESNKINIVSTTSLGQNKNLHVIEVNGIYSLIGATPQNITHIRDIKKDEIMNFLREQNVEKY